MKVELNSELLHELLTYDDETGKLFWRSRSQKWFKTFRGFKIWNGRYAGKEAFTSITHCGYKNGRIFDVGYRAHRVIWCMVFGEWPENDIDHINGDRCDNRIINLRHVDRYENNKNCSIRKDNKSGKTGVRKRGNKWAAMITVNGDVIDLGAFYDFDEACSARDEAERKYGFHNNHGRKPKERKKPNSQNT